MVNYRNLRWHNRNSEEFRHLKLLLYWLVYGILFYLLEAVWQPDSYFSVQCFIDDYIPFCEAFVIPYIFWFVYLIGIHLYTLLYDVPAFKKLMRFIIISYSISLIIFFLFPNQQDLRLDHFERSNALTDFVSFIYQVDSNTNVCPSLHVVGSLAVWFTARETKLYQDGTWKIFFQGTTPMICFSTVFLKQHSIIDVIAGYAVGYLTYKLVFSSKGSVWMNRHKLCHLKRHNHSLPTCSIK